MPRRASSATSTRKTRSRSSGSSSPAALRDLTLVRVLEPAALLQGLVDDALQRRGGVRDHLLRMAQAVGVGQRLDGGVDLLGGVLPPLGHGARLVELPGLDGREQQPAEGADHQAEPGDQHARVDRERDEHEHDAAGQPRRGGRPRRDGACGGRAGRGRPRRRAARARRRRCRSSDSSGTSASEAATPPMPHRAKTSRTTIGPWRRSSRPPKTAMPTTDANCAHPFSLRNGAVTNRHGSPSSAVSVTSASAMNASAMYMPNVSATSRIVAHGRPLGSRSTRMPGISFGRSLLRRGAEAAPSLFLPSRRRDVRGGFGTPPSRSIFVGTCRCTARSRWRI